MLNGKHMVQANFVMLGIEIKNVIVNSIKKGIIIHYLGKSNKLINNAGKNIFLVSLKDLSPNSLREAEKKSSSLNGRAILFLESFFPTFQRSNVPTAIKLEWGGG